VRDHRSIGTIARFASGDVAARGSIEGSAQDSINASSGLMFALHFAGRGSLFVIDLGLFVGDRRSIWANARAADGSTRGVLIGVSRQHTVIASSGDANACLTASNSGCRVVGLGLAVGNWSSIGANAIGGSGRTADSVLKVPSPSSGEFFLTVGPSSFSCRAVFSTINFEHIAVNCNLDNVSAPPSVLDLQSIGSSWAREFLLVREGTWRKMFVCGDFCTNIDLSGVELPSIDSSDL